MSRKQAAAPRKVGVIIANTGTPEAPTRKAVKKYLSQFLMDPRICPMPRPVWWTLLHTTILRKRSRASAEKYQKICDRRRFASRCHYGFPGARPERLLCRAGAARRRARRHELRESPPSSGR